MSGWTIAIAAAVAAALGAETLGWRLVRAGAKLLASSGVLGAALAAGAPASSYGRLVLVALVLCWLGDAALLGRSRRSFALGLAAFSFAHLVYAAAFAVRGLAPGWAAAGAAAAGAAALPLARWLLPHLPPPLRAAVLAYLGAISLMGALALGSHGAVPELRLPVAAALFWISDLAVARERFVAPGIANRLWGLPLYYAAQLLFAASTAKP
ncbi:MAG: hypothetical protein KatS3mg102_1660 [Planctomycetota bacterium]|nr:MAG: hypothetical protein KatS3mg102_1660 [Planctomycetota bacterium]